ncbi:ribonuclease [Clostridium putrefaciens]|uniref:ribonuclease H n=1 Tax=Clostridium putrefaciens TaxID=99675 RepID=A0A381J5D1_9CLOT|nr:ribonuclease H family protein [Clostridium putrefaciens]SUY46514.1 ribonuclease [Clostridium putrefaciens]
MGKFYAVKNGRKIGIYDSWNECKKQIDGYKGAIYKSFSSYDDAYKFINSTGIYKVDKQEHSLNNINVEESLSNNNDIAKAYVDGSYSDLYNMYSYGVVILHKNEIVKFSGRDNNEVNLSMRNVAGELLGAIEAIKWAIKNNIKDIYIHYDYEGIEKWATGIWKTNKEGTKSYKQFIDSIKNDLSIRFIKVKAHSGVTYNEEADVLAKSEFDNINEDFKTEVNHLNNVYLDIFSDVIKKEDKSKSKNQCSILFKGQTITDNKLKKIAKEIWKLDNKAIADIENINVQLVIDDEVLNIDIKDVFNEMFKYNIIFK